MTFRVRRLELPVIDHSSSRFPLYPHQVEMWGAWEQGRSLLLAARTGTGKTRAAILPVLKRREWAVAVYPTNELLRDQVRAVAAFANDEGIAPVILTPHTWGGGDRATTYSAADYVLVPIDGALLDQWQGVMACKSRGETLRRLLNPDKPKIVFTNPDILFLILALRYHAEALQSLQRYATLITDEFHLYQGVELAHALAMIAMARGFGAFQRLILLSATPPLDVQQLLDRAVDPVVIESGTPTQRPPGQSRIAVHSVEVTPIQLVPGSDPVEAIVAQLIGLRPELERLRAHVADDAYLPAVVIVNSVINAIRLEDRLVETGFARNSLAIIRGLSHRAIRQTRRRLLALGTSAIEVGVDFQCDYLLFEASEAASFLQRFGRVGRHRPGKAIVFVPPNAFAGMSALPAEIDRSDFEDCIYAWYPSADARSWFVTTEHGMITARTQAENLVSTVQKDGNANPEVLLQLRTKVETILANHAERLGCGPQNIQARVAFERCRAGKSGARWLNAYQSLNRFRTSLPSVKVHDFTEQHRRQDWEMGEYDADIAALLKRAVGLAWNEKLRMLTLRGLGKYRRVHASEIFTNDDSGLLHETRDFPQLRLYQDGESTPVSDVMAHENHIFAVVPKAHVKVDIDWRMPVFESGAYVIAFDGAALLLLELWRRRA